MKYKILLAIILVITLVSLSPVWALGFFTPKTVEDVGVPSQAGVIELQREVQIDLKFVVTLSSTRTENELRQRLSGLENRMKDRLDHLIGVDPETSRRPFLYKLKITRQGDRVEIYPKLVLVLDTTRSKKVIRNRFVTFFDFIKREFRLLAASDPQTSIIQWHLHTLGGSVDEIEP